MSQGTVEERRERLETVVEGVVRQLAIVAPRKKDWRRTIGVFDGDPVMRGIVDDALHAHEQERQRFYAKHDRDNGCS